MEITMTVATARDRALDKPPTRYAYDAFLSYSHAADGKLAPAVQSAVHQFAKPWHRLRAVRIFRDITSLSATPQLWPEIRSALDQSRFFILLASREAAASHWVREEIEYWKSTRSAATILIGLTDGEVVWDPRAHDFDWDRTTALPTNLKATFLEEPLYLDFRPFQTAGKLSSKNPAFSDLIASLSARIRGRDKDELVGEDITQHRRAKQTAVAAVAALALLTVAAIVTATVAVKQWLRAEVRLAESWVAEGDALVLAGRVEDARERYLSAWQTFEQRHQSPLKAELGLWDLERRHPSELDSLADHDGDDVNDVAISPDGRLALAAHGSISGGQRDQESIALWDLPSGRKVASLRGHDRSAESVAFSPDGRTAISSSFDGTLKLWEIGTGKEIRTYIPPRDSRDQTLKPLSSVRFCPPDGLTAVSGGFDGTVRLWDVKKGRQICVLGAHHGCVRRVAVSADGSFAVSAGDDQAVKFWSLRTRAELVGPSLPAHDNMVFCVALSPDGRTALSGGADQVIKVWDTQKRQVVRAFERTDSYINSIAFSPDGRIAISGGGDGNVILWDVASGHPFRTYLGHARGPVNGVAFSPGGDVAVSGGANHTMKIWAVNNMEAIAMMGHEGAVQDITFSPDGKMLVSGGADKTAKLWDVATGHELAATQGVDYLSGVQAVAFDGRNVLIAAWLIERWDVSNNTATVYEQDEARDDNVKQIVFRGHDTALLGSSKLREWAVTRGRLGWRVIADSLPGIPPLAFSGEGQTALVADYGGSMQLWDLQGSGGKKLLRTLADPGGNIASLAVSADGQIAASGHFDGSIRWWNLKSGQEMDRGPSRHEGGEGLLNTVSSLAFSPNGRTAVSSADRGLKIWDVATGTELRSLEEHTGLVNRVAFSPRSDNFASAAGDATVRVWRFSRGAEHRDWRSRVSEAKAVLRTNPQDAAALGTLGGWYAFRGVWEWAIPLLEQTRDGGSPVSPLLLGRCYWQRGRREDLKRAEVEFQKVLASAEADSDKTYLRLCIRAIQFQEAGPFTRSTTAPVARIVEGQRRKAEIKSRSPSATPPADFYGNPLTETEQGGQR